MKITQKINKIKKVCTSPIAQQEFKDLWKSYSDGEISAMQLSYDYDKLIIERKNKGFSWENAKHS